VTLATELGALTPACLEEMRREAERVLDQLTMFVVLAEEQADKIEHLVPHEVHALRATLDDARALLAEVRP
jgi:hypothetical protein